MENKDFS